MSPSRRRSRRLILLVTAAAAVAFVGIPSTLGSAWAPWSDNTAKIGDAAGFIAKTPADDPGRGLVHSGLKPGKKGRVCAGEFQIEGTQSCTHGPDEPPAGLDVRKDVAPIAPAAAAPKLPKRSASVPSDSAAAEASGAALAEDGDLTVVPLAAGAASAAAAADVGPSGVVCDGDGVTGKRVQVMYVYEAGIASRFAKYQASFRTWSAGVDAIYDASAQETGGTRHLRYVTTADCQVDVREVEVPAGGLKDFSATMSALRTLGWNRTDRKYMIFAESNVYCGIGTFTGDDKPGAANRNNSGASYGRSDSGCWSPSVAAHELGHNLGAVSNSAPNSSKAGHCVDDYDVMCYKDTAQTVMKSVCTDRTKENRLDCNHDDYYSTDVKAGSYLASHWNVADNLFLIAGTPGGGNPSPSPTTPSPTPTTPSPTPTTPSPSPTTPSPSPTTPSPSPTSPTPTSPSPTSPSPTPTGSPSPDTGLAPLTLSDAQPTSVRLSWPAKAGTTRYSVVANGRSLGTVAGTGVRVVGLRPGTAYRFQITVGGQPYTTEVSLTTAAAYTPKGAAYFSLTSALTGTTADLYGGRSADRTPLVASEATGAASELWRLVKADGGFRVQSKATGKCISPLGGVVAGAPLVQSACASAPVFTVDEGADGLSLATGGLVAGLGEQRYGGQNVLTLQQPSDLRHQRWAALPA